MSNDLYVTCQCGYEVQVPASALGTTLECINCEADIEVSEETTHSNRTVHEPGLGTQRDTARETMEPEESRIPISPFDPSAPTTSPSAFEEPAGDDDVFGTNEPWKPEGTPTSSPFEDESEEPYEPPHAKPKPTAPSPRVFTEVTEQGAHDEVDEEETCPRCGNPYRGDWDKQTTEDGELCYICSNQGTEKIPERLRGGPRVEEYIPPADRVIAQAEGKSAKWFLDPESEGFRRMLWVLAVGTILLAIILNFSDDYQPPNERDAFIAQTEAPAIEETLPQELPGWALAVMWVWQWTASMAAFFIALYVVLLLRNKLPHETIKANTIVIGVVTLISIAMTVAVSLGFWWLGDMPFFLLVFLGTVVGLGMFVAQIIILIRMLNFGFIDFVLLYFLFGLSQGIVQAIGMFFYWGLATVAL